MSPRVLQRSAYRRNLPHLQNACRLLFVTMRTYQSWTLPGEARSIALDCIRAVHERRAFLYCAVVMPDHAHMLFQPLLDGHDHLFCLAEIMHAIRGPSAHAINKAMHRKGHVWQEEFFDRLLRYGEFEKTMEYICRNPERKGLVRNEESYPWLWVEPAY